MMNHQSKFSATGRLFGIDQWKKIAAARFCVIGVGGVGSWSVEALARLGCNNLTLVDLDDICVSNINRQVQALDSTVGKFKIDVLKERCLQINNECQIDLVQSYFSKKNENEILKNFDVVIDAIDSLDEKCQLIKACIDKKISIVVTGAAGGKSDPTQIVVDDLAESTNDRLLHRVRKNLRETYGLSIRDRFGVRTIFSREKARYPTSEGVMETASNPRNDMRLDCSSGFGTASFVTGAFGFFAASEAVKLVLSK